MILNELACVTCLAQCQNMQLLLSWSFLNGFWIGGVVKGLAPGTCADKSGVLQGPLILEPAGKAGLVVAQMGRHTCLVAAWAPGLPGQVRVSSGAG